MLRITFRSYVNTSIDKKILKANFITKCIVGYAKNCKHTFTFVEFIWGKLYAFFQTLYLI